jgi:hypothetical protein
MALVLLAPIVDLMQTVSGAQLLEAVRPTNAQSCCACPQGRSAGVAGVLDVNFGT